MSNSFEITSDVKCMCLCCVLYLFQRIETHNFNLHNAILSWNMLLSLSWVQIIVFVFPKNSTYLSISSESQLSRYLDLNLRSTWKLKANRPKHRILFFLKTTWNSLKAHIELKLRLGFDPAGNELFSVSSSKLLRCQFSRILRSRSQIILSHCAFKVQLVVFVSLSYL